MKKSILSISLLLTIILAGCASNQPPEHLSAKEKQCWYKAKNWMDYQIATQTTPQNNSIQTTGTGMMNQGMNNIQTTSRNSAVRKYISQQANTFYQQCIRGY